MSVSIRSPTESGRSPYAQSPIGPLYKNQVSPFDTSLLSLLCLGVSGVFVSLLLPSLAPLLALPLAAFLYEWTSVHSYTMTRKQQLTFDEANILATNQTNAWEYDPSYVPQPPTPLPSGAMAPPTKEGAKNAFEAWRDAHYAEMYKKAMTMEKEVDQRLAALIARKETEKIMEIGQREMKEPAPRCTNADDIECITTSPSMIDRSKMKKKRKKILDEEETVPRD